MKIKIDVVSDAFESCSSFVKLIYYLSETLLTYRETVFNYLVQITKFIYIHYFIILCFKFFNCKNTYFYFTCFLGTCQVNV